MPVRTVLTVEIFTCAKTTLRNACASVLTRSLPSRSSRLFSPAPRARRAAADEGDARGDGVHQLVHQQSGEQRADQPEMKAEREADERRRDGGVAGLALREDGRRGQGAMMA